MKRQRENEGTTLESWDMRICSTSIAPDTSVSSSTTSPEEVFECKTCNRKFNSFQALGGHRACHNKRVKMEGEEQQLKRRAKSLGLGKQSEPKMHNCSVCGQGFSLGQALGGHRASTNDIFSSINKVVAIVSVLKRSCNDKVFCLDLNLTPLENDLKLLLFGKLSPNVNLSSF